MLQILYERGWVGHSLKPVHGKWAAGWGTARKRKHKPTKAEFVAMQKKDNGPRTAALVLNSHQKRKYKPTKTEIVAMQKKDNGPRAAELVLNSHLRIPVEAAHRHAAVHAARLSGRAVPAVSPRRRRPGRRVRLGKAKLEFRRHINDLNGKHLHEKVLAAMGDQAFTGTDKRTHDPPLPLSRVRRFARRARTNRDVLEQVPSKAAAEWLMAAWQDGKLMVNGQTMDATKASPVMQKILDAIFKVEPSATTSAPRRSGRAARAGVGGRPRLLPDPVREL